MAEGKKSFVLYTDIIHVFKKLPKDKQADLIMMILEYVNDTNPVTEDILVDIAFDPIKRQLKRDLVKYESRAERSRENGSKGGRPSNQQEPKKPNGFINNPEEPKKPDTVIDIVIGNVNNNNKSFIVDANKNPKEYQKYFFDLIANEYKISRDELFLKCKIDLSQRNDIWQSFISNSVQNVPLIEDSKHAWNTFKKFVTDNKKKYQLKESSNFNGFE
jgi:hypothetical protein